MNIDKQIHIATAVAALVFGSALVLATPHDPFAELMTIVATTGDTAGTGTSNGLVHRSDSPPTPGVVLIEAGGTGVRAPAQWLSEFEITSAAESVHLAARL